MKAKIKSIILISLFTSFAQGAFAQINAQVWLEYIPTFVLPKSFSLELRAAYRTNFADSRWHTYELRIMPKYTLNKHITFLFAMDFIRTHQNKQLTTFEIREAMGASFHLTPLKRVQTGITIKGEQRNVENLETNNWNSSTRLRILGSVKAPLNKPKMSNDHVLYAAAELEVFIAEDDDIQERFANNLRVYGIMGYKVSHNSKLEIMYIWQESKNTIYGDVSSAQNIFRFRFLQKFGTKRKEKPKELG